MPARKSAVEQRQKEIERQLALLRHQLARKSRKDFTTDFRHRSWLKGTNALIAELLDELSALADPGEYDELPAAVVADELGLTRAQVRMLIRLGEIEALGRPAHERISRAELARIAGLGAGELLRLGRQESAEIFEEAVPLLRHRGSDLEAAERAYRRLERREGWATPYAPAFLVGLELARDDPAGAISTVRLIYGIEDHLQRLAVMSHLGRALRGVGLNDGAARQVGTFLADLADRAAAGRGLPRTGRRRQTETRDPEELQRQAAYLAASVMIELRGRGIFDEPPAAGSGARASEEVVARTIRDTLYSALYAEAFYDGSPSCRMYADMTRAAAAEDQGEAKLLTGLSARGDRGR